MRRWQWVENSVPGNCVSSQSQDSSQSRGVWVECLVAQFWHRSECKWVYLKCNSKGFSDVFREPHQQPLVLLLHLVTSMMAIFLPSWKHFSPIEHIKFANTLGDKWQLYIDDATALWWLSGSFFVIFPERMRHLYCKITLYPIPLLTLCVYKLLKSPEGNSLSFVVHAVFLF